MFHVLVISLLKMQLQRRIIGFSDCALLRLVVVLQRDTRRSLKLAQTENLTCQCPCEDSETTLSMHRFWQIR